MRLSLTSTERICTLMLEAYSFKAVTRGDSLVFLWAYSKGEEGLPDDALAPVDLGESLISSNKSKQQLT